MYSIKYLNEELTLKLREKENKIEELEQRRMNQI